MKSVRNAFSAAVMLAACGLLGATPPVYGADSLPVGQLNVSADTLTHEQATQRYTASGNVRLTWDGLTLTSRTAEFDPKGDRAVAEGDVLLTKNGEQLRGDRLSIDLNSGNGDVSNGELHVDKNNLYVRGAKLAKVGDSEYRVDRGSITTCDGDSPSWKFTASSIDLRLDTYGTATNALFYIKDLPVLYLPYLVFPTVRDRQSGFLIPQAGNSSVKGLHVSIPFYWAVSPSQDVTLEPEYMSKRGFGMGLDYRYMRKLGSEGIFRGYGMFDTVDRQFRGEIQERHLERFSDTLIFKSDIHYLSDKDYYRDFSSTSGEYNLQKTESTVSMTKYWSRYSLTGNTTYIQDLQAPDNTATLQTLPSVVFSGMKQQLWRLPLYVSADSSFVNFYREQGLNGQRVSLHPQLTLYLGSQGAFQFYGWGGYQQRFYNTYGDSASAGRFNLGLADAGAQMSASFDRIYDLHVGSLQKLRHQLVPEVSYLYVQNNDQDRLPFFDYDDRIVGQDTITYGLSNYLVGRFDQDGQAFYRTLLYLRVSQRYSPSGIRKDYLNPVPETGTFGTVRVEARSNPLPHASLFLDSRYDPYHFGLSTLSTGGDFKDDSGNHVGASYYFARNDVEYLEGRLGLALIRPFSFDFMARYSMDKRALLESNYVLEYKHQCWSVNLSYQDRPGNKEFLVNFTLAGVGVKGPVRAF